MGAVRYSGTHKNVIKIVPICPWSKPCSVLNTGPTDLVKQIPINRSRGIDDHKKKHILDQDIKDAPDKANPQLRKVNKESTSKRIKREPTYAKTSDDWLRDHQVC